MNGFIQKEEGKPMKQSETTLKELAKRYRAVLLKCALLNAVFVMPTPAARAVDIVGNNTRKGVLI